MTKRCVLRWQAWIVPLTIGALSGCTGDATPAKAYENCFKKSLIEQRKELGRNEFTPFLKNLHYKVADQTCGAILTECDKDPDSGNCRYYRKRYKKEPKQTRLLEEKRGR